MSAIVSDIADSNQKQHSEQPAQQTKKDEAEPHPFYLNELFFMRITWTQPLRQC